MRGRVASAEEPEACVRARGRACELMFARASARACARVHTHADQCCRRRKARQRRRGSLCRGWAERHPAKWRQPIHATRLPSPRPQCLLWRESDSGLEDSFNSGIYNSGYASIGPSEDPAMDFRTSNDRHLEPLSWLLDSWQQYDRRRHYSQMALWLCCGPLH